MQWETALVVQKQESASRLTSRMTVVSVTPELVLAQEVSLMIPTRVEMRQRTRQKQAHQSHGLHPGTVTGNPVQLPKF